LQKESDPVLQNGFKNIIRLKVGVCYPFFLPVYNDYAMGKIDKDVFNEIISLLENYVFRRAICGIPTASLNKTFATLYKSIKKDSYLEGVKAAFQLLESYKRYPTDAEFEKEITTKDVYNFRSRNYLLSRLENFERKEQVNIEAYTIEHILPQNPKLSKEWQNILGVNWKETQEQYLHSLGNLTLTGYNSELSDRSFNEKKTMKGGFNDSPIRLNEFLRKVDVWNKEEIELRAKKLADKAKQIWFAPKLPQEILIKYKPVEKVATTYSIEDHEHLKGEMFELYQALKKRILNIDSSVKEEFKKLYIAFKSSTNFVDIIPQKVRLLLELNIDFQDIIDPKGLCRDVSGLGRWGNGDVEVIISKIDELDDVMELIQQAFDKQLESV
jgi:predicted transport protein